MNKIFKNITKFFLLIVTAIIVAIYFVGGGFKNNKNKILLNNGEVLIFAHKGVTIGTVENSIEAFETAKKIGFEAFETDINFTKDKQLVIFHDFSCKRLLGMDTLLIEMNLDDITNQTLLYKNKLSNNKVISLEEFIRHYKNSQLFYLDIKDINKTVADTLVSYLNRYNIKSTTLIADTNLLFLAYLKWMDSNIITVLEDYSPTTKKLYWFIPRKFKPNYCAGSLNEIDEKYIEFLKGNGYFENMIVYGVTSKNIAKVKKLGFKNVIIDYDKSLTGYDELKLYLQ